MIRALRRHWPEYAMEAAGLGAFLLSACVFATLLEHPDGPVNPHLAALPRRALMGLAMGATAVAIIYSPWGKRSGAHLNPAVTLAFHRLGKIEPWDARFYVVAHLVGAAAGVAFAAALLGPHLGHPAVNYAVTRPGPRGLAAAFVAEILMAFLLMAMVLRATSSKSLSRWTGVFAGLMVASYITTLAPVSGMSINPARTLGSTLGARQWTAWWLYLTAPLLGMLLAAEVERRRSRSSVPCAKLHHDNDERCIFRCAYENGRAAAASETLDIEPLVGRT